MKITDTYRLTAICLLILGLNSGIFAIGDSVGEGMTDPLIQRRLDRFVADNYTESYDQFMKSSKFYQQVIYIPNETFRFYPFESRIARPSLINWAFIRNPIADFIDRIPYEEYFEFLDQYYLSDITVFNISNWGNLRINLNDLAQGDYFMKLNINFYRPRR